MSGELVKLQIKAYSDEQFNNEVANGEFRTLLNPEKYVFKYKVEQNSQQASGTSSSAPRYNRTPPEDLDLEFIFDRTGVLLNYGDPSTASDDHLSVDEGVGIADDVDQFKRVVFDYNGDEHRPNYLIITWGALLFKGVLTEMDITFKLFKSDGTPLRATATAKFKGFIEDNLRVALENNTSPDLTHVRIVTEGDTLPLMTYRIYGDSKYYLEVAKVNKITNFRKLKVGQQIFFPPIEKVS
ncbi:LysM peptidoglycan-binding domain-containing protein [Maribellus luteus]|uniref:LysM peptidoglycan-binding domain-containing protein n=1 Tax=Maribellus luteus TaxID=2305463 RepID=A0A399SV75_9BACT|nr:LysM peptidoglycan-binding domain-containing protein [Maribellus luteus]RIJ46699.1 LysM peptidoglycan-binding domain-containing protein [Maribellus luteus]